MKHLLTGKQMREADRYTIEHIGIPSMVLMERAALGAADSLMTKVSKDSKILVVCGSGNNGGDGYAIARLLYVKDYDVSIMFVGNDSSRSEENRLQKQICDYYHIPVVNDLNMKEYNVVVDAIFGTGLSREISGEYKNTIEAINDSNSYIVSIDIPSGIHDTTGLVMGCAVEADFTVAIAYKKRGIVLQPGNQFAGEINVIDIGIYDDAIPKSEKLMFEYDFEDFMKRYPRRKRNSHKGSYGKIAMIVGSKGMSGAAHLSAKAAYMTGAGLVQIYTHEDNRVILQETLPEAIVTTYDSFNEKQIDKLLNWADVIAIGCGIGTSQLSKEILQYVLRTSTITTVIDADGLNILSEDLTLLANCNGNIVLTPHMKEMSRLLKCSVKELQDNRVEMLEGFTEKYPVTCVLKDARSLVAKDGEDLYINTSGNAAMAKGGSGDVLTGIVAGTVAQTESVFEGTCLSVYLHGLCGDYARNRLGNYSVMASDLVNEISEILKKLS